MAEIKMIDLNTVIGVYSLCNTGAVLVHAIDYAEDKILASINGENPEWCAQWEIRHLADEMLRLCRKEAPILFEAAGPGCVTGNCPESRPCGQPRNKSDWEA